uniref:Uncharacterized protein n=1 Tax=Pseudo-nitzschia australis TaxID=44445 RepID=A0A7S4A8U7_9STRA
MKTRKVNSRNTSASLRCAFKRNMDGCDRGNTHSTTVTPESIRTKDSRDEKDLAIMNYNSNDTVNDLTTSGVLDDFLNANGPLSVTIKTQYASPKKTASEMSCLTSPDTVGLFPASEACAQSLGINSSSFVDAGGDLHCNKDSSESRNLVRIKIESSVAPNSASFHISVPMMLQREVEMQAAARANNIGKERWTSSRIFRMWKSQCARQQQNTQLQTEYESRTTKANDFSKLGQIILRMTPEVSLQQSNSSYNFFCWKPWLTTCIQSYYNTGNLRIPDECTGDDILVAMEYFGILTASPDNFVFDSRHAYTRIQAWSRYFTYRVDLAESLLEAYDDAEGENSKNLTWVLVEEKDCVDNYQYNIIGDGKNNQEIESVDLHSESTTIRKLIVDEDGGLYELFCETRETKRTDNTEASVVEECERGSRENKLSKSMPLRMRQDFCFHLRRSLPPWSEVRFEVDRVKVTSKIRTNGDKSINTSFQTRPVIRIDRDQRDTSKSMPYQKENYCTTNHSRFAKTLADDDIARSTSSSVDQLHLPYIYAGKAKRLLDKDKNNAYAAYKLHSIVRQEKEYSNYDLASRKDFDMVEATKEPQTSEKETFTEMSPTRTPITYVNMKLGDLRSVTSVLSEPIVDDSGALNEMYSTMKSKVRKENHEGIPILVTAKRIVRERSGWMDQKSFTGEINISEQPSSSSQRLDFPRSDFNRRIETPPRTTRNLLTTPPWDLDQYPNGVEDINVDENDDSQKSDGIIAKECDEDATSVEQVNEVKATGETDGNEWDDENSGAKSEAGANDLHGSWGQLLASMCEAIIPVDSRNALSSSPTRNFTISSSKSTASTVASSDDEHQTFHSFPSRSKTEFESQPNGFVDQAKRFGSELSNQFDELMKIAYNEKDQQDTNHSNGYKSLSPILEEVPEMLAIDTDEDHTLSSCLTTSIVGQPCKIRGSEAFEKLREKNDQYLSNIVTVTSGTAHGIPKSKSFESDPFSKSGVDLPHRKMQRIGPRLGRCEASVARKKNKFSTNSERKSKNRCFCTKRFQTPRRSERKSLLLRVLN